MATALLLGASVAAEVPAQTAQEIEHLLDHLSASGCEFNRNGDWYPASEARVHLEKKYRYLLKKGLVKKAEDFIVLGATESSMSHTPYQVRCGGQTQASGPWLDAELQRYRRLP